MGVKIFDKHIVKVDSKGGIKLPEGFIIEDKTEICYMNFKEPYFNIYPLQLILNFADELQAKKKYASIEEYKKLTNLIRTLYASIIDTYILDDKRKILLPKQIKDTIEDKKVILQGVNQHITLCTNENNYDNLMRKLVP